MLLSFFEPLQNTHSQSTKQHFKGTLGVLLLILISNYAAQIQSTDKTVCQEPLNWFGQLGFVSDWTKCLCKALGEGGL